MSDYPDVLSEEATLELVLRGKSLSRYGDGEFKMCRGGGIKSQDAHPGLSLRLRQVVQDQQGHCVIGIPNLTLDSPKSMHWLKYRWAKSFLNPEMTYGSAFVSRPDSAPWIDFDDYWQRIESLWLGRDVTLVRGSGKSLIGEEFTGANMVREIVAPIHNAWSAYDELLERIGLPGHSVLICLGPTATVMASDLSARGVHAVDLGHVGMFLRKRRRGQQMVVTDEDRMQPC